MDLDITCERDLFEALHDTAERNHAAGEYLLTLSREERHQLLEWAYSHTDELKAIQDASPHPSGFGSRKLPKWLKGYDGCSGLTQPLREGYFAQLAKRSGRWLRLFDDGIALVAHITGNNITVDSIPWFTPTDENRTLGVWQQDGAKLRAIVGDTWGFHMIQGCIRDQNTLDASFLNLLGGKSESILYQRQRATINEGE